MNFRLLENGIDSLKFGLQFYYQYLKLEDKYNDENPGLLKMAVISIHNAVELLSKKLLTEVNEVLIYKNLDSEVLLEVLGEEREAAIEGMGNIPLEWSLISRNADIQTIDYSVCIKRLTTIFKLSDRQKYTLDQLSHLRNKLTHFGISRDLDFFRILIVIDNTLKLIMNLFSKELKAKDREHLDSLYIDIEDVLEEALYFIETEWIAFYSDNFVKMNNTIKELINNENMVKYLKSKELEINVESGQYSDSGDLSIIIKDNQDDTFIHINTHHIPDSNLTLFLNHDSGLIYFLIDHNAMLLEKSDLYIYKSFKSFTDLDLLINDVDYWEKLKPKKNNKSQEQNECMRKEFNMSNIIFAITQATNEKFKNKSNAI